MNNLLENVILTETDADTNSRNTIEYHTWREAVLERDRNTCQCCGVTNDLQVHHIKNFSSNIELRYDVSNGITLCRKHHDPYIKGSFHFDYGVYNNSKEQLKNYIMSKWEEENQRKKSELEQKESLSKNEQLTNVIIDKNINYLNSNEFKSLFPFLSIYVNNNIKLIETIYESFREKYTQHKYNDDIIYFKRFTMLRDICDYTPYESYLFSSKIILLLALGILVKRDENEFAGSIKICFNSFKDRYSYRMLPDIYIIPEFNDIYFSEFENVAKQIFEAKIDVDTLNYEYVSKNYRDIFNYRCFDLSHNNKRIKYLDDKDNYNKIKEVCDWIINELEKNAYIKEHDAYDKYWEEWCSYGKNITNFYDLKCTMTTKNIKSKYGITEDGDFYILHL